MEASYSTYPAVVAGPPFYTALSPFPAVCFILTLLTDVAYWQSGELLWQTFSSWLLFAGLVVGALAALIEVIGLVFNALRRRRGAAWLHFLGTVVILLLALVNALVHAGDGWTAVVPWGLALSAATAFLVILVGWLGRSMLQTRLVEVHRYG